MNSTNVPSGIGAPIPNVILVASGPHKVAVIRTVLKCDIVYALIIDEVPGPRHLAI
ncbi:MAG: hypothetical protein U1E41_14195 [Paracoccus sp. (in: a-proteobacteria)]